MPDRGAPFFFVFPDNEAGSAAARHLREDVPGLSSAAHASGRDWIVGRWEPADLLVARAGRNAIALIGTFSQSAAGALTRRAGVLRDPAELDDLALTLSGQFHLLASVDGALRVQGSAYGARRVFHTRTGGTLVAGDRAAELARLAGLEPDPAAVALRLLGAAPAPLDERPMWSAVTAVPPGAALLASPDGVLSERRWHRPPEPVTPLDRGAAAVRDALLDAVEVRTAPGGLISSDLSGGLDSTTVCFLAARDSRARLIAATSTGDEAFNEDGRWARWAAEDLPGVEHYILPNEELPKFYDGFDDPGLRLDAPTPLVASRRRVTVLTAKMAARGSRLHLTGNGGDNLFVGLPHHLHTLLVRHPLPALRRLSGFRALLSWPLAPVARQLADRRGYRAALAAVSLRDVPEPVPGSPALGWLGQPSVASWLTEDCLRLLERELAAAAPTAVPYGRTPGRHTELAALRGLVRGNQDIEDAGRAAGVPMSAPFLDDRVVDAAFSVRALDRVDPWAYKPLLVRAMDGLVPRRSLSRTTKGEGTQDVAAGLYRNREALTGLWEDSMLGRAGLVDEAELRRLCAVPSSPQLRDDRFLSTLAAEMWLRTTVNAQGALA
ncbi:asparagine synthase-related protein (plasmid) [Streptomyces sp. NBC_00190]|uniref:asparagine synthase-related protein n=1 Tax=unclassified Streptomyces TaxID=2593676 RepID=UPI002E298AAF|nr:asparagine synthase-related protein [Streptomyces sp. NBC_00190]WSZ45739.1 asparagine synthase-related protein [Streptomyces sp. NBC_00868]